MPDVIEPAASGRAKCRACGEKIEKGALRFGEAIPNPYGEGEETKGWFHLACAAEQRAEKLRAILGSYPGDIPNRDEIDGRMRAALDNPKLVPVRRAERSPSGRATCQDCHEKIEKGALRVVLEREADVPAMSTNSFIHAACAKNSIGTGLLDKLRRKSPELSAEDLAELETILA